MTISEYARDLEKSLEALDKSISDVSKLGSVSILYLEDNPDDVFFLKFCLNDYPFIQLTAVSSYDEAIVKSQQSNYDAYIVDIRLDDPKYSGLDYIDFLNKLDKKPIIVLTGYANRDMIQKCQEKGVHIFFEKEDLVHLIQHSNDFLKSILNK